VEVADVRRAPIEEAWRLTGEIQPAYRYVVSPRVGGRVLEITRRVGDTVGEGDVLVRLDDSELSQAVTEAEASLRSAQATLNETQVNLSLAAQELKVTEALEGKKLVSRMELDKARAEHDGLVSRIKVTEAQVEQRESVLATARIRLGYAVLTAPRPGFVSERFVDVGSVAGAGGAILSVIGIDPAVVRVTVTEALFGRIRAGITAVVEVDAYPGRRFAGRVARIAPQFETGSRTADVEIEVANASVLLKPGMFAGVRIILQEKPSAQLVPTAAIIGRSGGSGVFVVDGESTARYVAVKTGIATPEVTEVLSPTLAGKVVTLGQHLLEDGGAVVLPGAAPAGGRPEGGRGGAR
jgi:RND family efflux transporter MFP subunit